MTDKSIKLTPITADDFALWKTMRIDLYGELEAGAHDAEMPDIFGRDDWRLWFVEDAAGQRIGLVELSLRNVVDGCLSSPVPYIEGLYVVPAQRNQGFGKQLIDRLLAWSAEQGYTELALNTWVSNEGAQRLYQSLGFIENERVVEYHMVVPGTAVPGTEVPGTEVPGTEEPSTT